MDGTQKNTWIWCFVMVSGYGLKLFLNFVKSMVKYYSGVDNFIVDSSQKL